MFQETTFSKVFTAQHSFPHSSESATVHFTILHYNIFVNGVRIFFRLHQTTACFRTLRPLPSRVTERDEASFVFRRRNSNVHPHDTMYLRIYVRLCARHTFRSKPHGHYARLQQPPAFRSFCVSVRFIVFDNTVARQQRTFCRRKPICLHEYGRTIRTQCRGRVRRVTVRGDDYATTIMDWRKPRIVFDSSEGNAAARSPVCRI